MTIAFDTPSLDALCLEHFEELTPPAMTVCVYNGNSLLYSFERGLANVEQERPVALDWRYPIGSQTKCLAAAAILLLRDEGKLDLNQPVTTFVPELRQSDHWQKVSIRHLLSMQSGLSDDTPGSWGEQHLPLSDDRYSELFRTCPIPVATPGTVHSYSNMNYMIIGRIISLVSGEHALEFISRRILQPLGMTETTWSAPDDPDGRRAQGYLRRDDAFVPETLFCAIGDGGVFGGLWSTNADMAKLVDFFQSAHLDQRSPFDSILKRESRLELQRAEVLCPFVPAEDGMPPSYDVYGLGLKSYSGKGGWAVGHSGAVPGFGCHMRWSREKPVAVLTATNLRYVPAYSLAGLVFDLVTSQFPAPAPRLHPLVAVRLREILGLLFSWSDEVADGIFSNSFFIDNPRSEVVESFARVGKRVDTACVPEPTSSAGLSATFKLGDSQSVSFALSPVEPGSIQELSFKDSLGTDDALTS